MWTGLRLNPGLRGYRPATNRLTNPMARLHPPPPPRQATILSLCGSCRPIYYWFNFCYEQLQSPKHPHKYSHNDTRTHNQAVTTVIQLTPPPPKHYFDFVVEIVFDVTPRRTTTIIYWQFSFLQCTLAQNWHHWLQIYGKCCGRLFMHSIATFNDFLTVLIPRWILQPNTWLTNYESEPVRATLDWPATG
jgi:hypothetical protein